MSAPITTRLDRGIEVFIGAITPLQASGLPAVVTSQFPWS
jgi:hypothetical protein